MIDQNEVKEPYPISDFGEDVSVQSRNGDDSKSPEDVSTKIKIITNIDGFEELEHEWKELARISGTHIFQTFEWNRIWWKHFGTNKKLHIVAVYIENTLAGIAPLFEDDITLLGRKVYSCLRFLGSFVNQPEGEPLIGNIPYSDYLDCIVQPGQEQIFYKLILQYFNEIKSVFDEIILDEVSEESGLYNIFIPLMANSNYGLNNKTEQASCSPVIQLDSTWKAYLDSLSVKDRYNTRRYYKRSKKGSDKVFNIEKIKHSEELPEVLTNLIQMHQRQWNNRGFAGTFSEKRMRDFFREITKSFYEKNWIQFDMAVPAEEEADKKYVAIDVLLTYKNRVYLMHRGMDEDPLYRKQGPGNVLLYARLKEAINDGVKVFDMLRGTEEFKLRMATKINQNKKITVYSDYENGSLPQKLVKEYMNILSHIRLEKLHIIYVFKSKTFFKGVTDYVQFMYERIKHKFYN